MEIKLIELRDRATFVPLLCVAFLAQQDEGDYLLYRCGYSISEVPNVMITRLCGESKASADPYFWGDRTFTTAHMYIIKHWYELNSGDVVDVEFILGEAKEPKKSERITHV